MSGSSWSRISILLQRGYCGNGIHCTGSLATWNCWLLEYWGLLRNLWKYCSRLEFCRNWFSAHFVLVWWSCCFSWSTVQLLESEPCRSWVSLHFSRITASSYFLEIRILEPYILSCLEWQCFNSILEIFDISIETCLLSSLWVLSACWSCHSWPVMVGLRCWIKAFFQIEFLLEMESHWRLECTCNLKVTGSKVDLVLQLFQLDS